MTTQGSLFESSPEPRGEWIDGMLVRESVVNGETRSAGYSPQETYRYFLKIVWAPEKGLVQFIGLNPSTATELEDDPTIRRCKGFARAWGYGGIVMTNLFAFRATEPRDMKAAEDPIGPMNSPKWQMSLGANLIVGAWGNDGSYRNRSAEFKTGIGCWLHALKLTKSKEPSHPLYLKGDLTPQLYESLLYSREPQP